MSNGITQIDYITIGATGVKVADRDSTRKSIYIYNSSTGGQIITLLLSNTEAISALKGIVLGPGMSFTDADSEGYECWEGQIWAISSAADGKISVYIR